MLFQAAQEEQRFTPHYLKQAAMVVKCIFVTDKT